jgi:hypothetical protein
MCELFVTCDVCMLNPVRSWLYIGECLKSLVISRTTEFIWTQVRNYNYFNSCHCTDARINWTVTATPGVSRTSPRRRNNQHQLDIAASHARSHTTCASQGTSRIKLAGQRWRTSVATHHAKGLHVHRC